MRPGRGSVVTTEKKRQEPEVVVARSKLLWKQAFSGRYRDGTAGDAPKFRCPPNGVGNS